MDICRVCLSVNAIKNIYDLQIKQKKDIKNYKDIMLFCLGIQVAEDSPITKKLCMKCFKKIILYYKFKSLALKSEADLKSMSSNIETMSPIQIKNEDFFEDEVDYDVFSKDVAEPNEAILNNNDLDAKVKEELDVKDPISENGSDNEFLNVLKNIKYELVTEEINENAPLKKKRNRSRAWEKSLKICEECGQSVRNLKEHSLKHQPGRKQFPCKDCSKVFKNYGSRSKHYKAKHLGIKHQCNLCDKVVVNIRSHKRLMHETASLPFKCTLCPRRFIAQPKLDDHMTAHTKERPYRCDICDKTYRTRIQMIHHTRQVHDKEKSHMCQFCSKSFFKKYHLQIHLRSHTKEKPYPCPDCDKSFSSSSILNNHRMLHSDVKPFQCSYCDATFVRLGYLRAHERCHTKEKRHPCRYCGVKFGRSDHRKRHEGTAHEKYMLASTSTLKNSELTTHESEDRAKIDEVRNTFIRAITAGIPTSSDTRIKNEPKISMT